MADAQGEEDVNIEMWKIKKLVKSLEAARGSGTSMISLVIPVGLVMWCTGVLCCAG
jgi:peptide chain release factor subunit 1